MTERALSTEVQILHVGGSRDVGTATLELRGNALVLHYARKNRLVTRCFSMTEATRELRPSYPFHMLWYGLTAAVFTLLAFGPLSARFGLDIGSPALLFLIELSAVATGLWLLIKHIPTSAIEFRFNNEEGVFSLTVEDDRTENPSLATITNRFRPYEHRYHQYRNEPSILMMTNRIAAFPFHRKFELVVDYFFILCSPIIPIGMGYHFQDSAPNLAVFLYCFSPIYTATVFWGLRRSRTKSPPPIKLVEFSAQGKALKFLQQGESNSAIEILVNFLADTPEATHARKLLVQIYISLARYDDALALFQPLADSTSDTMAELVEKLECFKSMTKAEMSTIN